MTITLDGTTGITSPGGDVSVSQSLSGNLTFTGTGNRITGDFSNATIANRVTFQSSTTNANTSVGFIPNGTATQSVIRAYNNSDPTNAAEVSILCNATVARLQSAITGTGTYLPLTFDTNGSERMRIDTSGNVGIGTSSPSTPLHIYSSTQEQIRLGRNSTASSGYLTFYANNSSSAQVQYAGILGDVASSTAGSHGGNLLFYTTGSGTSAERMRIDSSGSVLIGTTSNPGGGTSQFIVSGPDTVSINNTTGGSGTAYAVYFKRNATGVGSITVTGSNTAYNTSSDYRLKENVAPMTGALATVAALKPCTYTWKADGSAGQGFIAHELQEFAPYAVSGEKDGEEMQGVDYGKLTPILTAALQEAVAKIETLEARIAVLEAK